MRWIAERRGVLFVRVPGCAIPCARSTELPLGAEHAYVVNTHGESLSVARAVGVVSYLVGAE